MDKIEKIKQAIEDAENRKSNLTPDNFDVPGLVSLLGRHLYNNIGALSTRFCEVGSHLGCSFTSTVTNNNKIISATAIDSFASDWVEDRQCMPIFLENVKKFIPPKTEFKFIHKDAFSFDVDEIIRPVDFYIYDGSHDFVSQKKAFTYYKSAMAEIFITVIDDFDWDEVRDGTYDGIKESNLKILFQHILEGNNHDNDGAWNGYGIFLLQNQ